MNLTLRTVVGPARPAAARGAFTLLEVLVSLGVIVAALAGIAAFLPAAGTRLGEATVIDRAGTMAANARADLATRGFLRASLWQGATGTTPSTRAIVCGEGLAVSNSSVATANTANNIPTTGFRLADDLSTSQAGIVTGTAWGVCYGCMISSPAPLPATSGSTVRMTTVVFRRPAPLNQSFTLTGGTASPVFSISGADAAGLSRRQYLPGCSWALAVPTGAAVAEPRWVPITTNSAR
ncbi:MAG: hypothetical protein ACKOSQ_01540, partial [Planctomycetaceae bacterium]